MHDLPDKCENSGGLRETYYKVRITIIFILVQINNSGPPKKFLVKFEFCALLYSGEDLFVVLFSSVVIRMRWVNVTE